MTRVLRGLSAVARPPRRAVVTVGMFDGVHLAHRRLVTTAIRLAKRTAATSVVVTFDPDPKRVLDPRHAPPALMPLDRRVQHLAALGVDWIVILRFTHAFSRISAERFVRTVLARRLHAAWLVVGEDFTFGHQRQGDLPLLRTLGDEVGVRLRVLRHVRRQGAPISSSRIRRVIADGELGEAKRLLGRPPELYGIVVRGLGRGRRFGVPTVNIRIDAGLLPPHGVYAVRLSVPGRRRAWGGVMNLGVRPTFGGGPVVCEVHLLGFSGALNGHAVVVSLLARLRDERCFASPQALYHQVRRDIRRAGWLLSRQPTRLAQAAPA